MRFVATPLLIVCYALLPASLSKAQIRIVTYNTQNANNPGGNPNPGLQDVLQGIGNESVNGVAKRIDILSLQEQNNSIGTTTSQIQAIMNNLYGAGTYARGTLISGATNNPNTDSSAIIYDQTKFTLVSEVLVGTPSTSGMPRQEIRYQFRPVGYSSNSDFYVYVGHWKASGTQSDMDRRNVEAQTLRSNANTLAAGARIMYTGDFNLTGGTSEDAWTTLTAAGNGQGIDPAGGSWANVNRSWSSTSLGSRLDFLMHTPPMNDGRGFSYISGSHHTFGNNGSTPSGSPATSGSNTALAGLPNRSAVLSGLTTASDHYPVVAQYRYPAKMSVAVGSVPSQVIVGASVGVNVTVTNTAPTLIAAGADGLDYSVTGSGSLTGNANVNMLMALSPGNVHALNFNTGLPGVKNGSITVSSTSQEVASGSFGQNVSTTVLAHANASFQPGADSDALHIDFGIRALGENTAPANFAIHNLADPSGFTAALDVDFIDGVGDVGTLTTTLTTFSNLAPSSSVSGSASIDTAAVGSFNADYLLENSDQDLPGASTLLTLHINLTGRVAYPGDATLDDLVNLDDFNILASNFGNTGQTWTTGDFTHDGLVDLDDFNILASNFGLGAGADGIVDSGDWAALAAAIPEPASLAPLLLALAAIRQFRHRRRA